MQSQKQVGKPCDHSKRKAAFNPILCMMVPHGTVSIGSIVQFVKALNIQYTHKVQSYQVNNAYNNTVT